MRGLAKKKKTLFFFFFLPRVPTSYRYGKGIVQLEVLLIFINTQLTNSTVPNRDPIVSNSIFDDLFLWFKGEFNGYHAIYFKDVTSLFYYFLDFNGDHVTTHSVHHTVFFFFFFYFFNFFFFFF